MNESWQDPISYMEHGYFPQINYMKHSVEQNHDQKTIIFKQVIFPETLPFYVMFLR
jgi:hypothetical protein